MWSGVGETVWVANNEWRWSLKMVGLIRPSHCFTEGVTHPRPACAPALAAVSARSRRRMTGRACAVERPLSGPATPWNISCRQHIDPMPHTCLNIDISQGKKKKKTLLTGSIHLCQIRSGHYRLWWWISVPRRVIYFFISLFKLTWLCGRLVILEGLLFEAIWGKGVTVVRFWPFIDWLKGL